MLKFDYIAAPDLLAGKVVLVSGAGDGIGKAVAVAAAGVGATTVLLGRTVRKLEQVYDDITAAGGDAAIYPLDMLGATADDYDNLTATLETEFGTLHGLVNNAGLLGNLSPVEHYDLEIWAKVMKVNVTATFLLTRACLTLMKQSGGASIIFTSSGVGRRGRAYWGAYAVSKFATEGMMQVVADETAQSASVRANCINPGAVRTHMRAAAYPAENPDTLLRPDEVTPPYLYLLGADSADINGQSIDAQ
ncbi:MAG: YciK family oxidoreductase [Thiotrichales bacterium]|nr:YciK family oxidoreductase [Thiotrichales bacterium]